MTLAEILSLLLFGGVCVGLMAGYPVVFTLGGVSLIFGLLANALGVCHHTLNQGVVVGEALHEAPPQVISLKPLLEYLEQCSDLELLGEDFSTLFLPLLPIPFKPPDGPGQGGQVIGLWRREDS